ncbi:HAD family hydrolase [Paenibacillus cisolokensis]|nr:HAD family hydrolase [Paenibacillus cisolokensis]
MMQRKLDAVLFDLDNTLLDRDRSFDVFAEMLARHYFPGETPERHRFIAGQLRAADMDGYKDKHELFRELPDMLSWAGAPAADELFAFYSRHYPEQATLMEAAEELLDYCGERYRLGLITNGGSDVQNRKIDRLGIRARFGAVVVSGDVGIRKPDPAIFRLALSLLDVLPERALYIGDHPRNDMAGACEAGLHTVWFERNQPWDNAISAVPLRKTKSLRELIGWL